VQKKTFRIRVVCFPNDEVHVKEGIVQKKTFRIWIVFFPKDEMHVREKHVRKTSRIWFLRFSTIQHSLSCWTLAFEKCVVFGQAQVVWKSAPLMESELAWVAFHLAQGMSEMDLHTVAGTRSTQNPKSYLGVIDLEEDNAGIAIRRRVSFPTQASSSMCDTDLHSYHTEE